MVFVGGITFQKVIIKIHNQIFFIVVIISKAYIPSDLTAFSHPISAGNDEEYFLKY